MARSLSIVGFLIAVAGVAGADSKLVVLPATDSRLPAASADKARKAIEKAAVAPIGKKAIDTTCAADTACLITAGTELGANRVVSVAVSSRGAELAFGMMLVDIETKELIAKRDVAFSERKLAKDLGPAIRKFVKNGPIERAKDLFGQAGKHFNLGEYTQALELYKRAYRVKALPAFLFNIAQCHRKLGQHKDAMLMYQSYLVGVPGADNRKLVESLIVESKTALAQETALADKRASEAVRLESERIAAAKKKVEDERKAKEADAAAAAERRKIEEARIRAQRERELDKVYDRHPTRKFALVGGVIGAGGLIAGGVFALLARSAQTSFDTAGCGDRGRVLSDAENRQCQADIDRGEKNIRLRNLLLGSGGGVFAVSLFVFVIDPGNKERPEQARASVIVSPSAIQAVIRW